MKLRQLLIALMLFVSLSVWGNKPQVANAQTQPQQPSLEQVQQDNEVMRQRLEEMEAKLEKNPEVVYKTIDDYLDHWINILAIIMTILGIAMPLIINIQNERNMQRQVDEARNQARAAEAQSLSASNTAANVADQVESASSQANTALSQAKIASEKATQAEKAVQEIERLKEEINKMRGEIDKSKDEALKAADDAKASKYYLQAFSISDNEPLRAIELYTDAIKYRDNYYEAYINRGILHANQGHLKEAEDDFRNAINQENDNVSAWAYYNLGKLRSKMNNRKEAIEFFSKAIEKKFDYAKAYNNRAYLYLLESKSNDALLDVNSAISYDSSDANFYDTRADIYMAKKMYKEAEEDYTQAINRSQNAKQFLGKRAICYHRLADIESDQIKKAEYLKKAKDDEEKSR